MPAKKTARKKSAARKSRSVGGTIRSTAGDVDDEVENAGSIILREIGDSFAYVSDKVSDTARAVASTTGKVTEKVTGKETAQQVQDLLSEVEEAGESLLGIIGKRIDSLRRAVAAKVPRKPAPVKKEAAASSRCPGMRQTDCRKPVGDLPCR